MKTLNIAYKDILQMLRDWKTAFFLVVMPVFFTIFFGLILTPVFSADQAQKSDPRLPVGWINADTDGVLEQSFFELLSQSTVIRPVVLTKAQAGQAGELVAKGELAAVIRIPPGYSQAVFADQPAQIETIVDQTTSGGRTVLTALDTVTGRLLGAVETAHLNAKLNRNTPDLELAFQQSVSAWKEPPLTVRAELAAGTQVSQGMKITGFMQSSSGMIVQFVMFGLINSSMLLVMERKTRCLQRLLTAPVRRAQIIGGHVLAMFLVVFFQETVLILLGQFVFGVDYLRQPLAVLLLMLALALWSASLGLLIGALARKEDQVILFCLITMMVFSALGGAWFPLEVAGKTFSSIGHALPTAWAMDGFQNLLMRGLGFQSVLLPASILLAYALAFFGLALWRFKFEE